MRTKCKHEDEKGNCDLAWFYVCDDKEFKERCSDYEEKERIKNGKENI